MIILSKAYVVPRPTTIKQMTGLINKTLKIASRAAVAGLISFELLNAAGILLFSLDFTWLGLSITAIFCWAVIEIISGLLKKSYGAPLAGWTMLVAAGAVYMDALGDILHFYGRFGWYDQFAHFAGGAAVAILTFDVAWRLAQKHKMPLWFSSFSAIAATALFGALYEIEEYLEDYFTGSHRLGDGPDTANDLMLDIIGAVVIIALISITFSSIKKFKQQSHQNF